MAQHDYEITNAVGLDLRADLNGVLGAIVSVNLGPVEPPQRFPGMWWMDTALGGAGVLRVRTQQNDSWLKVPTGGALIPLTGGDITGDLNVAGIFSNPEFSAMRGNHAGPTPPTDAAPGMLWYDTSTTPPTLRGRNQTNDDWISPLPSVNAVFINSLGIQSTGPNAYLNLTAATERRRVLNDANGNQVSILGPTDAVLAAVLDGGTITTQQSGNLKAALDAKQATIGFTTVQQGSVAGMNPGVKIYLGWDAAIGRLRAQAANTAWGWVYTTNFPPPAPTQTPQWSRGQVGTITLARLNTGQTWNGNALIGGDQLWYGYDGGSSDKVESGGTWRNLGASIAHPGSVPAQRVL